MAPHPLYASFDLTHHIYLATVIHSKGLAATCNRVFVELLTNAIIDIINTVIFLEVGAVGLEELL